MTRLYDLCKRISQELERTHSGDPVGLIRAKGQIATRTGFLVGMVGPGDHDDPDKMHRLLSVAGELGIHV